MAVIVRVGGAVETVKPAGPGFTPDEVAGLVGTDEAGLAKVDNFAPDGTLRVFFWKEARTRGLGMNLKASVMAFAEVYGDAIVLNNNDGEF